MQFIFKSISYLIPLILSLTIHEYAHAKVAYMLGDDTAQKMGRMTLNPLVHIDFVGTILIPVIAALGNGLPLIGWAKPVPVMPVRYTRRLSMHTADMIVSVSGPLSNILLSFLSMIILKVCFNPQSLHDCFVVDNSGNPAMLIKHFLATMTFMNIGLGIFNLIPVPPLDGSHLLPRSLQPVLEKIMPFSYLILIGIVYFLSDILFLPVRVILLVFGAIIGMAV